MGVLIVHITTRAAWEAARSSGSYRPPSVAAEGFVHFSDVDQVVAVANTAFSGKQRCGRRVVPTSVRRLNLDAVVATLPFVEDDDGYVRGPC